MVKPRPGLLQALGLLLLLAGAALVAGALRGPLGQGAPQTRQYSDTLLLYPLGAESAGYAPPGAGPVRACVSASIRYVPEPLLGGNSSVVLQLKVGDRAENTSIPLAPGAQGWVCAEGEPSPENDYMVTVSARLSNPPSQLPRPAENVGSPVIVDITLTIETLAQETGGGSPLLG